MADWDPSRYRKGPCPLLHEFKFQPRKVENRMQAQFYRAILHEQRTRALVLELGGRFGEGADHDAVYFPNSEASDEFIRRWPETFVDSGDAEA